MNLSKVAVLMGVLPPTVGLPPEYFAIRGCFIDARGPLFIDEESNWGFCVRVLTESHSLEGGRFNDLVVQRPVSVAAGAWIGSFATLLNCRIGEGAVVAAGSVVRSCEVAPRTMVAGNPARVIARSDGREWHYLEPKWRRLE